jgi:signal transduction histidine kinase
MGIEVGERRRRVFDGALAGAVALGGVATLAGHGASAGELWGAIGYVVVVSVPLWWRRQAPVVVAATIGLLGMAGQLTPIAELLAGPFLLGFAVAAGTVGLADLRWGAVGWTGLAVLPSLVVAVLRGEDPGELVTTLGWLGLAFAVGRAIGYRRSSAAVLREQAIERRVTAERLAIARDLHDVVAQAVGAVSMQATVGLHLFDDKPAEARAALERIRSVGLGASHEIRELLGLLRGADTAGPVPGLGDLPKLVASSRVDGPQAAYRVIGEPRRCDPLVGLTLYRVAQEALTNVRRHAQARTVVVELEWRPEAVALTVVDDGVGAAGAVAGHGIQGMRERLALVDGELEIGTGATGGFRVTATAPSEEQS